MLICYPVPGKAKSDLICRAFAFGAPRAADGFVFFGTEGIMGHFVRAKASGRPWYYLDNAYFDKHRGIYFRATKNALQVDPSALSSDGRRFEKLAIEIKAWREQRLGDVLVCPQSESFMKSTLGRTGDWTADTLNLLEEWGTQRVRVRRWDRDKVKAAVLLQAELPNLRLLITHSSAAAITAMLEGVPAISEAGAARSITGPLTRESVENPPRPGARIEFARVLADNQFTLEEFRKGTAWAWLNRN
jgi:hypothetical protein